MSMLAEPRRKQRVINLRAKNNAWSDDSNKFGQRMLEKMGWISGKGLGAKENGMVDHVVARYKNDEKGLGYEDKNDQWTKHEDDFNALLANLSNGDVKEEKLHSGVSLEDKSKKSKARVHYHKFTRGKDLTKYSEKDLANIFGKKSLKNKQKTPEETVKDVETKQQIFTDKGSMADYFKSKMAALKTKQKMSILNNNSSDNSDADYAFKGFSGATNDTEKEDQSECKSFSFYGVQETNTSNAMEVSADNIDCDDDNKKKKKKRKDKHKKDKLDVDNKNLNIVVDNTQNIEEVQLESRKKKKKCKLENLCADVEISENINKSKKKKVKVVQEEQNEMVQVLEDTEKQCEDYIVPKKKKKRKNKNDA